MSNRVIKISIVLIFMLFVTGLFNFCFAVELTSEELKTITYNYTNKWTGASQSFKLYVLNPNFKFDYITPNNVVNSPNNSRFDVNDMDNYSQLYMYAYKARSTNTSLQGRLFCAVAGLDTNNNYIRNHLFGGDLLFCCNYNDTDNITQYNIYEYDFDNNVWNFHRTMTDYKVDGSNGLDGLVASKNANIYAQDVTEINNLNSSKLVYTTDDYHRLPTTEELINNCDFNVRIEFGDSEELSSNYPINNYIGMQKVTILHSLTDWKYYNVKLNVTLEDYGFWINQRFHYAHYSTDMTNDEIKDVKTICIEEPTSININKNDYLGIYSAQAGKYVRLQYKLYNKNNDELILTRTIRFRFDGDGFFILQDSSDVSGTILEDSLKDNNGNGIDKNSNNVVSNGKDLTDINTDFDFSSGFKLDVDTLKGTLENSIESSKSFFNLFSTFLGLLPIWISTLLYFFLFGVIIITLYRFLRGA